MSFHLTFLALGRLAPTIVAAAISYYLLRKSSKDKAGFWLAAYFLLITIFNLSYVYGYTAVGPSSGFAWYVACVICLAAAARLQFAYCFHSDYFPTERKVIGGLSIVLSIGAIVDYVVQAGLDFKLHFHSHTYGAHYQSRLVPFLSFVLFAWGVVVLLRVAQKTVRLNAANSSFIATFRKSWRTNRNYRSAIYMAGLTLSGVGVNSAFILAQLGLIDTDVLAVLVNVSLLFVFGAEILVFSHTSIILTGFTHRLVGVTLISVLSLIGLATLQANSLFADQLSAELRSVQANLWADVVEPQLSQPASQPGLNTQNNITGLMLNNLPHVDSRIFFIEHKGNLFNPDGSLVTLPGEHWQPLQSAYSSADFHFLQVNNRPSFTVKDVGQAWTVYYNYDLFRERMHKETEVWLHLIVGLSALCVFVLPFFFRISLLAPLQKLIADLQSIEMSGPAPPPSETGAPMPSRKFGRSPRRSPLNSNDSDEIRQLRQAFGQMTNILQSARRQLPDFSPHLGLAMERALELCSIDLGSGYQLLYRSKAMHDVVATADRIAPFPQPVLIHGETGTGKELMARYVHLQTHGQFSAQPFIALNCASIPEPLWESEIFGHVRGAFTGANQDRAGAVEQSGAGTLFFDEIGEMPLGMQAKMLRLLQEREFTRLGGTGPQAAQCRFLFATNRDLAALAAQGKFREDLLYRIKVFTLRLPPLRERREDIPELVRYFVKGLAVDLGDKGPANSRPEPQITEEGIAFLAGQDWPGNIRQLENVIVRALSTSVQWQLDPETLQAVLRTSGSGPGSAGAADSTLGGPAWWPNLAPGRPGNTAQTYEHRMKAVSRALIQSALEKAGGNKTQAAKLLGLKRTTFNDKLKELDSDENPSQ